jgi:hypothetical protein
VDANLRYEEAVIMEIVTGTKFGALEVVGRISGPDEEERYRLKCGRCRSDCVTGSADALLSNRVRQCWDCSMLARLTPQQKTLLAFKKRMDLTPVEEETEAAAQRVFTVGEVLAA